MNHIISETYTFIDSLSRGNDKFLRMNQQ